jgi:hypothetical protein
MNGVLVLQSIEKCISSLRQLSEKVLPLVQKGFFMYVDIKCKKVTFFEGGLDNVMDFWAN